MSVLSITFSLSKLVMPEFNYSTLLLLGLLLGIILFLGKEFEKNYPNLADYASDQKPSTWVDQLRAGAFIALDVASDAAFPGKRQHALDYKKNKMTNPDRAKG